jgi:hypothetical protein
MPQTIYAWGAAAVALLHLAFIAFAVGGAGLLWRWPRLAWLHLPAALWAAYVEFSGEWCPLTPLENRLRALAGTQRYAGDFIEHYLVALIYPAGLTREHQLVLGALAVLINAALYAAWLATRRGSR